MEPILAKIKKILQGKEARTYLRPALSFLFFCCIAGLFLWSAAFLSGAISTAVEKPEAATGPSVKIDSEGFYRIAPRLGITPKQI